MMLYHTVNWLAGAVIGLVVGHVTRGWVDGEHAITGIQWGVLIAMVWASGSLMSSWWKP